MAKMSAAHVLQLAAALLVVSAAAGSIVGGGSLSLRIQGNAKGNMRLRGGSETAVPVIPVAEATAPANISVVPAVSVVETTEIQPGGTVKVVLRFRTNYKTRFGENMVIIGSLAEFGSVDEPSGTACKKAAQEGKGARMQYINDDDWGLDMAVELDPTATPPPTVFYRYVVVDDNCQHIPIPEGGARVGRALSLAGSVSDYPAVMEVRDFWKSPTSADQLMLSAAFTDVIFNDPARKFDKPSTPAPRGTGDGLTIRLTLQNARVERGHVMGVIGSCTALGNWEDGKVTPMSAINFPMWEVDLEVPLAQLPMEYRYVIMDQQSKKVLAVEQGDRAHRIDANPTTLQESLVAMAITGAGGRQNQRNTVIVNDDTDSSVSNNPLFKHQWRGAGVAVPVFGLRSEKGMGVGEFLDLKLLIDWCVKSGMKLLQLLPVTDTVSHSPPNTKDSYPYSSISVYALHPQYLRLSEVPGLSAGLKAEIDKKVKVFNDPLYYKEKQWDADLNLEISNPVDFPNMMMAKLDLLKAMFAEQGQKTFDTKGFKEFWGQAEFWLRPYGLFCYFRDFFGTANPDRWGDLGTGMVSPARLAALTSPESDLYKGITFYYYVQYLLHVQMLEVSQYAAEMGVVLKGDLPIGIDHDSVDAWYTPQFFNMDKKTGAPPDDYAEMGQNWGFPTYNWPHMKEDGYKWWRNRLGWMANYFQAYRIDHILGFFRIWEMPASATGGLLGKFSPSLPISRDELRQNGLEQLIDRLTEPYIRQHLIEQAFGHDWKIVVARFMEDAGGGCYKFKPGLNSEVVLTKIVEDEGPTLDYKKPEDFLYGLRTLINNVVLLRDDKRPNDDFYPRIEMWKCTSFKELGGNEQHKLRELYQNYFYNRQDQYWADEAMNKLPPLLDASSMMVCGEDLGMIPACVKGVLENLVVMGLKIQRMPAPGESDGAFGHPDRYPHLSVCTPSCHDMSTVAAWWEQMTEQQRQTFWSDMFQRDGVAPRHVTTEVSDMIIKQHLWSPSCWAVFPLQDLLAMDQDMKATNPKADQINVPANPQHYWRWRSNVSLEKMLKRDDFSAMLKKLLADSGRHEGY